MSNLTRLAHTAPSTLYGRESELTLLERALARARSGQAAVVLVEGAPGAGKSRLLAEAARRAAGHGLVELHGPGRVAASWATGPWNPHTSLLDDVQALLADARHGRAPGLVVLDDLPSAELAPGSRLESLLLRHAARPLLWVLARRAGDTGAALPGAEPLDVTRIALGPLRGSEVARLLADRCGGTPGAELLNLAAGASGNPRMLTELVRGLVEEGRVRAESGTVQLVSRELPQRVHDLARHELLAVGPEAQHALRASAVLGGAFTPEEAVRMTGQSPVDVCRAFHEALDAGLVEVHDETSLTFRHELVRRALKETVPAPLLRMMHLEAGRMYLADPEDGTPLPGDAVPPPLPLTAALARDAVGPGRRPPFPLSATLDRAAQLSLLCNLVSPDRARALRRAEAVVANRVRKDPTVTATALVSLAAAAWHEGRVEDALALDRDAVRTIGDGSAELWDVQPLLSLAYKLACLRQVAEAEELITRATDHIERTGLLAYTAVPLILRAYLLLQSGRPAEAAAAARDGLAEARQIDNPVFTPLAHSVLALVSLRGGRTAVATERVRHYQTQLAEQVISFPTTHYRWVALLAAVHEGRPVRELLAGEYADFLTEPVCFQEEPGAAAWLVRTALAAGDRWQAARIVRAAGALAASQPCTSPVRVAADHARALYTRDTTALEWAARDHLDPWSAATAHEDLALLHREAGECAAAARAEAEARRLLPALTPRRPEPAPEPSVPESAQGSAAESARESTAEPDAAAGAESGGWASLTDSERAIAELTALGMTNREIGEKLFRSPHTVNYYLRRIFRKVGVRSRVELAGAARSRAAAAHNHARTGPA
ncbi:LuxR C-terminal-related transcriptional regulator [Kitasatospora sp. HPMI-4]|uniref:LuxR C-terminal-related transcriptional regulator n=1 Tax=Kitasatospora sp. HPMI-4 TaxID=3448443 RepID=UPI003F1DBB90